MDKQSPRKELGDFVESGHLRSLLERYATSHVSDRAIDLAVTVLSRYCAPRTVRYRRRTPRTPG
jgi:hypothetical protein